MMLDRLVGKNCSQCSGFAFRVKEAALLALVFLSSGGIVSDVTDTLNDLDSGDVHRR